MPERKYETFNFSRKEMFEIHNSHPDRLCITYNYATCGGEDTKHRFCQLLEDWKKKQKNSTLLYFFFPLDFHELSLEYI